MKRQQQIHVNAYEASGFIGDYQKLVRDVVIPYQYSILRDALPDTEKSHVYANFVNAGMADLAAETGDKELFESCRRLWKNITEKKLYVTGAIGATVHGEAFSENYDLPSDTAYAETCASCGLIFFASRMLENEVSSEYADIMETAFYNTVLAGMQLDGRRFFYVNPLKAVPGTVHFANGLKLVCRTDYPYEMKIRYEVSGKGRLGIRIPGWSADDCQLTAQACRLIQAEGLYSVIGTFLHDTFLGKQKALRQRFNLCLRASFV